MNLFDYLSLDLKEYDELFTSIIINGNTTPQQCKKFIKKYPLTAEKHKDLLPTPQTLKSKDYDIGLRDFIAFLFFNKDSMKPIYKHPYIALGDFPDKNNFAYDDAYKADLKELQDTMQEIIDFCFFDTGNEKLNTLSASKRYFYLQSTKRTDCRYSRTVYGKYDLTTHHTLLFTPTMEKKPDRNWDTENPSDELITWIREGVNVKWGDECKTIRDFLFWELQTLLAQNATIKRCAYCGKLYIPNGKYNTDCCDRIPENEEYPCKKLMTIKRRKEK